ncbi:BatD family protein [Marinobacter nauticus]
MVKTVLCTLLTLVGLISASLPATAQGRDAFLELSADKAEVYVQEQLILSVRLYFSGALVQGDLSEPSHPDAIIERLGSQRESVQFRDGIRYQVIERRYAIFPQRPGTLALPAIRFEGHVRDSERRLRAVQDNELLYDVPVKPIPETYPADTPWLPARSLSLTSDGLPGSEELEAGQNLTRQLTLQASGLPAEALPPFPQSGSVAIRQYPDQPERHTQTSGDGLQGILQQSFALVPVQAGEATLPQLTVPWWNTETDQLERATLPARRYEITGSRAVVEPPASQPRAQTDTGAPSPPAEAEQQTGQSGWFWSTLVFAVLWLVFLAMWWHARQSRRVEHPPAHAPRASERQAFDRLIQAIKQGSPQAMGLLVQWARQKYTGRRFITTQDVLLHVGDGDLRAALSAFEEDLYSRKSPEQSVGQAHRDRLVKAVERARKSQSGAAHSEGLPPLYPPGLSQ